MVLLCSVDSLEVQQHGADGPGGGAVENRFQGAHNQFLKSNSVHCGNSGSDGGAQLRINDGQTNILYAVAHMSSGEMEKIGVM